jgi:hypothetical protein
MRTFAAVGAACLVVLLAPPVRGHDYDELGKLEKEAVDEALELLKLEIDYQPDGKTLGQVHVVNLEVFSPREGPLRTFNVFHATTRTRVIWDEVLLRPGQVWSQDLADETRRNLIDPFLSNAIVVLPVKSRSPGRVDLLVVTRDVWSLRLNSNFEVQNGILTLLTFSLSENNMGGLRKKAAVSFSMDQGAFEVGPTYVDPNIAGTHLQLTSAVRAIFSRESSEFEGTRSTTEFGYPLWSLATKWGASVSVEHNDSRRRVFSEDQIATVPSGCDHAAMPESCFLLIYDRRFVGTGAGVVRSFGRRVVHRLSWGHELATAKTTLTEDFTGDEAARADLLGILPVSETSSALFARYRLFTPSYAEIRDLDTFDFREDLRTGPSLDLKLSVAREELGSDASFLEPLAAAGWGLALGGGFQRASIGFEGRQKDGELVDRVVSMSAYAASPKIARLLRVIGEVQYAGLYHETRNRRFTAGSNTGLRGYEINQFACFEGRDPRPCHARMLGHVEVRTMPLKVLFLRLGAVAFWDFGHAAEYRPDLVLHHDVGGGFRLLIPQVDPYVLRLDWAIPLTGESKGLPGRVSLGFFQVF